jgi:FtsZ-binding cell division protein ZapB
VTLLATFKHISSKNADYGAAEQYLTFEHDEFTMKPTLDEAGRLILREDYRIATLNCGEEDFAVACMRSNLRYGKNQKREDVKSHHYIISFDPRDGPDNGLTVDWAQALGEEFCAEHFSGHQAIVCTHPDGHNHSGNIHVHIVINSLRIEEVPLLPYMDRPADTRAGCKHRCTDAAMEYFKAEIMEMCHRENLYQIDLLHGSKNRVTEREYWAQKKGQLALDKENAAALAAGQPVKQTKFETDKAKLRQAIRDAMCEAATFDEFSALLLQQGVTVKESRGRLSYLTPDRTKPVTARKLGDDFDRAAVLAFLEQNAYRAAEQTVPIPEYHTTETNRTGRGKTQKITPTSTIQKMVDRSAKRAEGKGIGYDRWAAVHNLKQMAATVAAMEQYGFTPEELDAALVSANADLQRSSAKLKPIETAICEKKELQKQVLAYAKTRDVRDGLKKQKSDKARRAYREKHESDFIIADAATRYFKQKGVTKLPTYKALQAEIEQLTAEKNALYNEYRANKARVRELQTMKSNLSQMQHGEPSRQKRHEQER